MTARSIGSLLRKRGLTIAVAESCTGGKLGDLLTDVPGSSDYFLGGIISYSNEAKRLLLGVKRSILDVKGAVSEETAVQMALGVRKKFSSDIGVGITGVAGPSGGTRKKPVGLVFIAVSSSNKVLCRRNNFEGSRSAVKRQSAQRALGLIEEFLTQ